MTYIYHEKQDAALCGLHTLNNLLQGRFMSEIDLMQIALALDAEEKRVMSELGTSTVDFIKFAAVCCIFRIFISNFFLNKLG